MTQITLKHPCILVDSNADYAEMDVFEGESRIYKGITHTYGKVLTQNWDTRGWYDHVVDTTKVVRALITNPDTFVATWEDCYVVATKYKRFGKTHWTDDSFFLPIENWDVPSNSTDIDDIKDHLEALTMLWVFEPNDAETRKNLQFAVERDLDVFKAQGDIHDYAVICDETNNTPSSIDRNELFIDVAIKPTHVAEFIFVPIHIFPAVIPEDPKPIKTCTLVKPGVSVTVIDESIYVSQAMVDEWNYDQAMKVL